MPLSQTSKRACQIAALSIGLVLPDRLTAEDQSAPPVAPPAAPTTTAPQNDLGTLVVPQQPSDGKKESADPPKPQEVAAPTKEGDTVPIAPAVAQPAQPAQVTKPAQATQPAQPPQPAEQSEQSGSLLRIARWLSKDFYSFNSPSEAARSIGLSLLSLAGGILAVTAGIRGVGKGLIELRKYMKENRDCVNGCDVAFPAVNEVVLFHDVRDDGKPKLMLQSRGVLQLTEVFPGRLHAHVVDRAARLCTRERPFPQQHFDEFLPKAGSPASWTPEFIRSLTGALPDVEMTTDVYHTSLIEKASALLARPLKGEGVIHGALKTMVIIPIAEKPDRRSTLEFVVIRQEAFLRFADPHFVQELRANSPIDSAKVRRRIDQIELAYQVDSQHQLDGARRGQESGSHFFPRMQILEKSPKTAQGREQPKAAVEQGAPPQNFA